MSYLDFERGITSKQIAYLRKQQAADQLRHDMTNRWEESEQVIAILRSIGSVPEEISGIEEWFNNVKTFSSNSSYLDNSPPHTPNHWFASKFPIQNRTFGRAFFEEHITNLQGSQFIRPSVLNEDFFAAILGGEKRLGHQMVHLPADGFWFKDPRVDAFCPTSDEKVEVLLSNYFIRCAESMGRHVDSLFLLKEHRRPHVLSAIVNRAKTLLQASPCFFEGISAPRRYSKGRVFLPSNSSSPEEFIHSAFVPQEDAVVIVGEAYQRFLAYCQVENFIRVDFGEFKRVARELVLEKFQLGLRHDIRTPEGRQTHGWKHLSLISDFPAQVGNAA